MRAVVPLLAAVLVLASSCHAPGSPQEGPGAALPGAPDPVAGPGVLGAQPAAGAPPAGIRLPERITLPASYRLMLLDGHLALVREADDLALERPPPSMRIVSGEIARGELAYQPALLPQELAAEVAANRESAARMDDALGSVMRRSQELADQALELQAQSRALAERLQAAEARVRELEAAGRAAKEPASAPPPAGPPQ